MLVFSGVAHGIRQVGSSSHQVMFELDGMNGIFHLFVAHPWVMDEGDNIIVVGEPDADSGKTIGYGYRNLSKSVHGMAAPESGGWFFVFGSIVFCWAIFPLFLHLPAGVRSIRYNNKLASARRMLFAA